ncbi:MAG: hypothetical protein RBT49_17715 [Bacteroidales bacterium]|nr:hypothetical protein [Bacteroidales bacterium]
MASTELILTIYSRNIQSLISIFEDSAQIRAQKEKEMEARINELAGDEIETFSLYSYHFDWLLLQALFISGFTYFEVFMKSMAEIVEKEFANKSKIKLNDIKGNGHLDTYRKYLFLIGEIEYANENLKEWKDIQEFKLIRNAITHDYGIIKKKLNKIIEHDLFLGKNENFIRIRKISFLEDFVKISTSYMNMIVEELDNKIYNNYNS